jgi:hypothetical protein
LPSARANPAANSATKVKSAMRAPHVVFSPHYS